MEEHTEARPLDQEVLEWLLVAAADPGSWMDNRGHAAPPSPDGVVLPARGDLTMPTPDGVVLARSR